MSGCLSNMSGCLSNLRVALVYDRVNKWGGAERVLLALNKIFPEAPLYTTVYHQKRAKWARVFSVKPSFLQSWPLARTHHELYPWLAPLAFESFDFREFDLVISLASAEAKGVITRPPTLHLCYCLTPTRYLWSGYSGYLASPGFGWFDSFARNSFRLVRPYLSKWDLMAAQRPDFYLAISKNVKRRIKRFYQRDAEIIYPPIDLKKFKPPSFLEPPGEFFLIVSRLVPYKRVGLAVEAFYKLNWPLKVVGVGSELKKLRGMAGPQVEILGGLTERELLRYYCKCKAVICPQEEDLGLVPLEAQACGKPVISLRKGGALETVIEGRTGEFFYPQTAQALARVVKRFVPEKYLPQECRKNAARFGQSRFIKKFQKKVVNLWQKHH